MGYFLMQNSEVTNETFPSSDMTFLYSSLGLMKTKLCNRAQNDDEAEFKSGCLYVKVSLNGVPYLRRINLKTYNNYMELSSVLEKMFSCFTIGQCHSLGLPRKDGLSESSLRDVLHGSEYVLKYEDKDGDGKHAGDVP
ncbi:Auxin-responsive protein IAA27 [Glycine soja]